MTEHPDNSGKYFFLVFVIAGALVLRLLSLGTISITDPSEGRYAVIGQEMFLSGDWITQRIYIGDALIPFLAKPPLHAWATASSFAVFGMGEAAARVPSLLAGICVCALIYLFAARFFGVVVALWSCAVLCSSLIFYFISGFCLTDPLLCLGTTLAGASFGLSRVDQGRRRIVWQHLFFVGMAIGFLVKGPIAIALVVIALLMWMLTCGTFSEIRRIPWISGGAVFLALVLPWYLMAERSNPGFLRYFFINENVLRFLVRNYGDKYGSAHTHPYGMIWIMLLGAFFPWSALWIVALVKKRRRVYSEYLAGRWERYALCFGLAPILLFTFARQTSFYYVLPGIPWLALCSGVLIVRVAQSRSSWMRLSGQGAALFVVLFAALTFGLADRVNERVSSELIIEALSHETGAVIGFARKVPYSARFYSKAHGDTAIELRSIKVEEVGNHQFNFLVTDKKSLGKIDANALGALRPVREIGTWSIFARPQ